MVLKSDMDEEMYGFHSTSEYADKALMSPENLIMETEYNMTYHNYNTLTTPPMMFGSDDVQLSSEAANSENHQIRGSCSRRDDTEDDDEDASNIIKAKIVSHPYYPKLLRAYIDCQKVKIQLIYTSF